MREPYQSKPNYPLLLAVIAVHALGIAYALRPAMFGVMRDRIAPANAQAAMQSTAPAQAAKPQSAQAQEGASPDPRREFDAEAWIANDERVSRRQERSAYGEYEARLANDPAKGLEALRQRYAAGDETANRARYALAWECSNGQRLYEEPDGAALPERLDGANPADAELARRVHEAGRQRWQRLKPRCAIWNAQPEEWKAATLKFRQGDTPTARFERIDQEFGPESRGDPQLLKRLIDALAALFRQQPEGELARRLGLFLVDVEDVATRERGLALLVTLAERDGRYARDVATAYQRLSDRPPYDREKAQLWADRAAQLGDARWIADRAELASKAGDAAAAWSWRAYALWVNAHGCHVARGSYGETELADVLGALGRTDTALAPAQREDATQRYQALVRDHGAAALEANDCGPE